MTDTIFIKGVLIHARHGVMEHESEVGQRFVIDLELYTDLSDPSRSDRLGDTVSYSDVVETATAAFKDTNYRLLERAAGAVADAILSTFARVRTPRLRCRSPRTSVKTSAAGAVERRIIFIKSTHLILLKEAR